MENLDVTTLSPACGNFPKSLPFVLPCPFEFALILNRPLKKLLLYDFSKLLQYNGLSWPCPVEVNPAMAFSKS